MTHRPASATLLLPDGDLVAVLPGDIVGRQTTAAARIDNPRVSEAHALVSLRGRQLKLLALRGALRVEDQRVSDVALVPGLKVALARGVVVEVTAVSLPSRILALSGVVEGPIELTASVYSLHLAAEGLRLSPGFRGDAAGHVWTTSDGWRLQVGDDEPAVLVEGEGFAVGAHRVEAVEVPVRYADATAGRGRYEPPLRLVARYESIHLHVEGGPSLVVGGIPARIVSELVQLGVPVGWEVVAEEIWPEPANRHVLRQNWDRHLKALRRKLKAAGIRTNLVRADGNGNVELVLHPSDEVVDQT